MADSFAMVRTPAFLPALVARPAAWLAAERGALLPWAPVLYGLGIGFYFLVHHEPAAPVLVLLAAVLLAALSVAFLGHGDFGPIAIAVALVAAGVLIAALRAHLVAAPVLPYRHYGPVEGRIVDTDRSFSDQPRLLLDRVRIAGVDEAETPARVRVALHGDQAGFAAVPGAIVRLTANIAPPDGPVEPGGFDFQRLAWFSGIGAVGYSRKPVTMLEEPAAGFSLLAFRMRMALSRGMQRHMEGQAGAFAAALMTGDRSAVTAATNNALRGSNLSHMISISGLHMGLLSGFVFALFRYGIALVPPLALRFDSRKLAAVIALLATTFYMILAGPDVAVRRSYIQAAVILIAVMLDRRALSLRSVAIAAMICLTLEPESLVEPGFQMSFGATVALIVAFGFWQRVEGRVPAILRPVLVMILSSLVAGTATAPIAAAHFNRIAEYGLIANLLAVPLMGLIVMPAGVLAALLAPVGLAPVALWVMGKGCALILAIAGWVAGLDGALMSVPTPPDPVLPILGLFGAVIMVGRGLPLRAAGASGILVALLLWVGGARPGLLVSGDGTLVGLMSPAGRALSRDKGAGFVAKSWLENDGDLVDQPTAAARAGFDGDRRDRSATFAGIPVRTFTGKGAAGRAAGACSGGAILILSEKWVADPTGDCVILDQKRLRRTGALAIWIEGDHVVAVSAREWSGKRLWNWRPRRMTTAGPPVPPPDTARAAAPSGLGPSGRN